MSNPKKNIALKALLIIQTIGLLIYTGIAIKNDGGNFLAKAIEFAGSLSWMGQFALDFQCYLMLSALWLAWRDKYSSRSILLALLAMVLGIIVFAPVLLHLLYKEKGDLKRVLLGKRL